MISSVSTLTKEKPPYKIRKYFDGWKLSKWVDFDGHTVEAYLGTWPTHAMAVDVMNVDAGPSDYPLFRDLKGF